jgi:predicted transcriptional regulator of viral defense system
MKKSPDFDQLYNIAETQSGYFTTGQARSAGYKYERLSDMTSQGQLIRVHHGIYRLIHFPASRFEDLHVASLRTGSGSVISHESALSVYGLSDVLPSQPHVIIPRSGSLRRKGIRLHTNQIRKDEITTREGLPITTPECTIADVIASGLEFAFIKQAIEQALSRGLTSKQKLLLQAERRGGRVAEQIKQVIGVD